MRVERNSFGQRMLNSFVGVLIGSFFLFYPLQYFINEGRENLAKYARQASEFNQSDTYTEEDLVFIVGNLTATTYAQDYYLKEGDYIVIERIVEMYACIEHEYQETIENIGGSSETIYTYSYTTGWTQNPQKAATFKGDNSEKPEDIPSNYDNWIDKMPKSTASQVSGFTINGVNVKGNLTFYGAKDLALSTNDVRNLGSNEYVAHNVIYRANNGSPNDIKVGDV